MIGFVIEVCLKDGKVKVGMVTEWTSDYMSLSMSDKETHAYNCAGEVIQLYKVKSISIKRAFNPVMLKTSSDEIQFHYLSDKDKKALGKEDGFTIIGSKYSLINPYFPKHNRIEYSLELEG